MSRLIYLVVVNCLVISSANDLACTLQNAKNVSPECISNITKNIFSPMQRNASIRNLVEKIDLLMDAPKVSFRRAQIDTNTTDELLDNFDNALKKDLVYVDYDLMIHNNIAVLNFKLSTTDILGMVIYRSESGSPIIQEITRTTSIPDVASKGNLAAAAYIPLKLADQISAAVENPVVSMTAFFKDSLFTGNQVSFKTSGIVFGILIPGFYEEFGAPVKLAFNFTIEDGDRGCAHWLYGKGMKGNWKQDRLSATCGEIEICEYYHITHFGMLVLDSTESIRNHQAALDVITLIGCIMSIIGIFGIFLTGLLFKQWRENKGNIILANQALATLLVILCLFISDAVKEAAACNEHWCFWSGIFLHYSVLAQFFWVLVISYLQYKRYVQIIGVPTTHLLLKACLIGWCGPLPIVIIMGSIFSDSYVRNDANICYPQGLPLFLGILLPILLIILINIGVFVLIMTSVFWKKMEVPRIADNVSVLRARLVILLFFQLGICWFFAFLSNLGIAFVYLFCITATTQGFVVFLLFIVFNSAANQHYKKLFGMAKKRPVTLTESSASTRLS